MSNESTLIYSKRISIMFDIIEREGFEFSTVQLHGLMGENRNKLASGIYRKWLKYLDDCQYYGYTVLNCPCGSDRGRIFATRVKRYYEHIGALDYYRGLLDA